MTLLDTHPTETSHDESLLWSFDTLIYAWSSLMADLSFFGARPEQTAEEIGSLMCGTRAMIDHVQDDALREYAQREWCRLFVEKHILDYCGGENDCPISHDAEKCAEHNAWVDSVFDMIDAP
jgi:hypothetical protein